MKYLYQVIHKEIYEEDKDYKENDYKDEILRNIKINMFI